MLYILSIIFFYFTYKILFVFAYVSYTERILFKNKKEFIVFIFNPILGKQYRKDKYFILYYYLSLVLSFVWSILFGLKLFEFIDILNINFLIGTIYLSGIIIFIAFLLYLSIFDLISFSIPAIVSKRMLLFAAFINVLFLVLKVLLNNTEYSYVFGLINLGTISNLLGGIVGGGAIWLIVKISKEKAMGEGDIDILAAIGLMLGIPSIFYSFFYTLMTASLISVAYVLIKRKFKGVLIPFVPFLASGFIICLLLQDWFLTIFRIY